MQMATILKPPLNKPATLETIPRLQNGDKLTRAEFERRYEAMTEVKKAELIEGEVYMPSPVRQEEHSGPHFDMNGWLAIYRALTLGIIGGNNGSLRLDLDNMPQPDLYLMIDSNCGGQARIGADGYVEGAPELIVEIAASSVSYDTHIKLHVYRRNGVKEYIVWRVEDQVIDWFVLKEGVYERLEVDSEGIYRSEVLPGLVLNPAAMIAGELQKVIETQTRAVQTEEHASFVKRLEHAGS